MMMCTSQKNNGFTLVEIVVVLGVSIIVVSALMVFFSNSLTTYRSQVAAMLAVANARTQLQHMTDAIRNAQNSSTEGWLQNAQDNALTVWTDIGGDGVLEKVAYVVSGTDVTQQVTTGGNTVSTTILRNINTADPFFVYYDENGNTLSQAARISDTVRRIRIHLSLYSSDPTNQIPDTVEFDVTPRQVLQGTTAQIHEPDATREATIILPSGTPPDPGQATATIQIKNPVSGVDISSTTISMAELNDGRVSVYNTNSYTLVNYKSATGFGNPAGWYAWVVPSVGDGSILYPVPLSALYTAHCLGQSWDAAKDPAGCQVLSPNEYLISLSETFAPLLTYNEGEYRTYIRDIIFSP